MDDQTLNLLGVLETHIKQNGIKKTISLLSKKDSEHNFFEDEYTNLVLSSICEEFSYNLDELLYSKYLRGDYKIAVGFCVYYLYDKISLGDISNYIFKNKHKSLLSRYKALIDNLNPKYKSDLPFIKIKDTLTKIILNG
jgi:hypothetical protein